MRAVVACVAVLGLAAGLAAEEPKPDPAKLVGRWEAKGDPQNRRVVFEFAADGKLVVCITRKGEESRAEGTYRLTDRNLTLKLKIAGVEDARAVTVSKLTDEQLMGMGEKGVAMLLVRITDE